MPTTATSLDGGSTRSRRSTSRSNSGPGDATRVLASPCLNLYCLSRAERMRHGVYDERCMGARRHKNALDENNTIRHGMRCGRLGGEDSGCLANYSSLGLGRVAVLCVS